MEVGFVAVGRAYALLVAARRSSRSRAEEILSFNVPISVSVLPYSVIFIFFPDSSCKREPKATSSLNGGFNIPGFGLIINFWFETGMESASVIREERSARVEEGMRVKVWGLPWWWTVIVRGVDSLGSASASASGLEACLTFSVDSETSMAAVWCLGFGG